MNGIAGGHGAYNVAQTPENRFQIEGQKTEDSRQKTPTPDTGHREIKGTVPLNHRGTVPNKLHSYESYYF